VRIEKLSARINCLTNTKSRVKRYKERGNIWWGRKRTKKETVGGGPGEEKQIKKRNRFLLSERT